MADVVIVQSIPYGGVVLIPPGTADTADERAALRAEFVHAGEHDRFVLLFPPSKDAPAGVVGPEDLTAALKATIADDVRDDLLAAARDAATTAAHETVAQTAAEAGARAAIEAIEAATKASA